MVKPAAEHHDTFDGVLRLGDLAAHAPAALRDTIHLGIRLTPEGGALDEITWLVGKPRQPAKASVCAKREPLLETIRQQLVAWFANPSFTFKLPLASPRSTFQSRLRDALFATQAGETRSYGDLAKQLNSAPRAVGQALGSNPLPIIVPCHRIISAGKNRLTGFNHASDGPMLALKAWLLEQESRA